MSASGPSRPIRGMLHLPRRPLARGVAARLTAPMSIHSSAEASAYTSAFRSTTARASASAFDSRTTSARAATHRSFSLSVLPTLPAARKLHTSAILRHGELVRPAPGTGIKLTFRDSKGNDIKTVEACEGDDILSLAHEHDVDLEGACERSLACSTCHVIISPEHYALLPEPEDEENDMLDLAFGLEDTSRLGCQVKMTRELDGMVATLPSATRNMYVDGAKARTH